MASTDIAGNPFESVRQLVRTRMAEQVIPSLALAVAHEGEVLWEEAFGWADRENRVEATPHTRYLLASVTKPMTATALMVLCERGLVQLDCAANQYLGEARLRAWVGDAAGVTVRRVANHTSGLPRHFHFFLEGEPCQRPSMEETIRRYGNLVRPPGERFDYSNLGYGVLDLLISRLSGMNYTDFMRADVFLPLGMTRASVGAAPELRQHQAVSYRADGSRLPRVDTDHRGASLIFCSAHDLIRFALFHLGTALPDQKAILSRETIQAIQVPTAESGGSTGYGIGWETDTSEFGFGFVGHGGGMEGAATRLHMIPSRKIAIAVLMNAGPETVGRLPRLVAQEILAVLLPEYAARRAEAELPSPETRASQSESSTNFTPVSGLIGAWQEKVHTYQGDARFALEFKEDGDVHAQLGGQLKTLLAGVRLENGALSGRMMGDIGTEDASRQPHILYLDTQLREGVLNGALVANSLPGRWRGNGLTKERWMGFGLAHWVELKPQG